LRQVGGPKVRAAAAGAAQALLAMASARLGVPASSLAVKDGVVSGGGRSVSYGELVGDRLFDVRLPPSYNLTPSTANPPAAGAGLGAGAGPTKPVARYSLVAKAVPRLDIPDKVTGKYTYIHNLRLPGMLHGRVVRPHGQAAFGDTVTVAGVDIGSIRAIADAQVVQVGSFVGIVAPTEYGAIQAAAQLKVRWQAPGTLPGSGNVYKHMLGTPTSEFVTAQTGDLAAGFGKAATIVAATYESPYQIHGPIGPSCAVADVRPDSAFVFVNSQNVYGTRTKIASTLGLPSTSVRVRFFEGSSCFGQSPYDDAAEAAALLSQKAGKPVRVQFMRWDEHGWDMYEPAHIGMVRAGIDGSGRIVAYDNHSWQHGWMSSSPERSQEHAGTAAVRPSGSGSVQSATARNSGGIYGSPSFRLVNHQLPGLNAGMLKSSNVRSPLCLSAHFSSEGMIDELAHAANMDPVAFRTLNMGSDAGWQGVLDAVAKASAWKAKISGSGLSNDTVVRGRGVALGSELTSYAAVVADIEVNRKTGKIAVRHLYGALDAGLTVNPGLVENQMVGLLMQGVSRTLIEELRFSKTNVTSIDWASYPTLRFRDAPAVTPVIVQRLDQQPTGAGEEVMCPVPAAIAHAFFDATGVRIRRYPMTPAVVRATLAAAA
jgi:CO/xanthine dehydrogenase Mo-binding subunit